MFLTFFSYTLLLHKKVNTFKVKAWKKENFHSFALGGLKESKQSTDEFARAQKQWAKLYKKVQESKKQYFNICKEEKTAQIQVVLIFSSEKFYCEFLYKLDISSFFEHM